MPSNIQIILVAGAAVLFLVILYLFFRPLFTRKLLQNSIDDSQSMLFEGELEQGTLEFQDHDNLIKEQELIILYLVSLEMHYLVIKTGLKCGVALNQESFMMR